MIIHGLTRADVEACLAEVQTEILGLGVRRLALFGSVQRGAAHADSDVDVLVEFQPGQKTYYLTLIRSRECVRLTQVLLNYNELRDSVVSQRPPASVRFVTAAGTAPDLLPKAESLRLCALPARRSPPHQPGQIDLAA